MSKVDLVGISQDLFLLNDLAYKYAVGKVNDNLNIYLYRTSLEGENINLFFLETNDAIIVVPASNEWDSLGIDGLYKITCIDCKGKFIFKEHNHMQTIKSASTLHILPIKDKEWEIEYSILDNKIRRFNIVNHLLKQESVEWVDNALSIIFNDEAEVLAKKIPTTKILLENGKSNLNYLDKINTEDSILGYIKIYDKDIFIDLEDKGDSYYVVNLKRLNKCFLYQQYITLFYIKTYYVVGTYTEIRLVNYEDEKYMVFINQNDEMIIDMTFVEVIDVLVREKTENSNSNTESSDNNTYTNDNDTDRVDNNVVHESQ
jgi:hypothetical protein